MSRRERPYAPGRLFHVTGRTNNKEHWLHQDSIKCEALKILAECVSRSDIVLFAYTIMSNHIHLLLRQGQKPLWYFAQPLFRRLARRIQLRHQREGHIFKGSYFSGLVGDANHMRATIDYIHYNPVDARLCKSTDEYAWSSSPLYTGCAVDHLAPDQPLITPALDVFASRPNRTIKQLQADYRKFAAHRWHCRALPEGEIHPPPPSMRAGDDLWGATYGTNLIVVPPKQLDLRDIVLRVLNDVAPGLTLDVLQNRRGGATIAAVRREIVRRATSAGHRGVAIADFLNISKSAVSRIRAGYEPIPPLKADPHA